jgi:hypothetical protein
MPNRETYHIGGKKQRTALFKKHTGTLIPIISFLILMHIVTATDPGFDPQPHQSKENHPTPSVKRKSSNLID